MAGGRLRGPEHRHIAGDLGGPVDELLGAEHGPDALQGARLHAGAAGGPAGGPRPGHRLHGAVHRGHRPVGGRGQVHQLQPGREQQAAAGGGRRGHAGAGRAADAGGRVVDGARHRPGLLRPAAAGDGEEGVRERPVLRLGRLLPAPRRGSPALLLLPASAGHHTERRGLSASTGQLPSRQDHVR